MWCCTLDAELDECSSRETARRLLLMWADSMTADNHKLHATTDATLRQKEIHYLLSCFDPRKRK